VHRAQRVGDLAEPRPHLLGPHRLAADEARDEAARLREEREHLRPDAAGRRGGRRRALGLAVDAEQVGLLAGQAHDRIVVAEAHPQVAIRDPAVE
jgi:hypothetical protein